MANGTSELESKLRIFHERKKLAVIEDALATVLTGKSLAQDAVPSWVPEAIQRFWDADGEPISFCSDELEPTDLASWTEDQLACHGIGCKCYVASHLSIKPWISCNQTPGWSRLLRTVVPEPILVLANDFGTVVGFLELEYSHAVYVATARAR